MLPRFCFIYVCALLTCLLSTQLPAQPLQWTECGPVQYLSTGALAVAQNDDIYFCANDIVYRRQLHEINAYPIYSEIHPNQLLVAPNGRIIASGGEGIGISNITGDSIFLRKPNRHANCGVNSANRIFAHRGNYLFRSNNLGVTWDSLFITINNSNSASFFVSPNGTLFLYTGNRPSRIYSSVDEGVNWIDLSNRFPTNIEIHNLAFSSSTANVYVGTHEHGIYISTSNGNDWSQLNNGIPFLDIHQMAVSASGEVYANCLWVGFYRRDPITSVWQDCHIGGCNFDKIDFLANGNAVVSSSMRGAYVYDPEHDIWVGLGPTSPVNRLISDGDSLYAVNTQQGWGLRTLCQSSDQGMHWSNVVVAGIDSAQGKLPIACPGDGSVLVGTGSIIRRSTNNGATWDSVFSFGTGIYESVQLTHFGVRPYSGVVVATGVLSNTTEILFVCRSTDYGCTWSVTGVESGNPTGITWFNMSFWLVATSSGIYTSSNDCASIFRRTNDLPYTNIRAFARNDLGMIFAGTERGVYCSTNYGSNWTPCDTNTVHLGIQSLLTLSNGNLLAGTDSSGVYLSTDFGNSWSAQSSGLENLSVYSLAQTDNGIIYAGTGLGVFRCDNFSDVPKAPNRGVMPRNVELHPAYPNPFNATTTIRYELPEANSVTLDVIDLLGRTVAKLVRQSQPAGEHTIQFSGENIASGIYFLRLQSGSNTITQKIILLH